MSNTDGRTNDSSGISAAVIPGGKRTQQSNDPERSRVATSENPQQHSSIVHLRLPVTYGGMVALVRFPCMSTDIYMSFLMCVVIFQLRSMILVVGNFRI